MYPVTNIEHLSFVRNLLNDWAQKTLPDDAEQGAGICGNLEGALLGSELNLIPQEVDDLASDLVEHFAPKWPKFSGNTVFPIPPTNKSYDAHDQFMQTKRPWSGKQGKLRRELCAFLVTELDAHIAQLQKEAA